MANKLKVTRTKVENRSRPGLTKCSHCYRDLGGPRDMIIVIEEQVNWFRGDDVVDAYHQECELEMHARGS